MRHQSETGRPLRRSPYLTSVALHTVLPLIVDYYTKRSLQALLLPHHDQLTSFCLAGQSLVTLLHYNDHQAARRMFYTHAAVLQKMNIYRS